MRRTVQGTAYSLGAAGTLASAALLADAAATNSLPRAVAAFALLIASLTALVVTLIGTWLKGARLTDDTLQPAIALLVRDRAEIDADRSRLAKDQMVLVASRAVLDAETRIFRKEAAEREQAAEEHLQRTREQLRADFEAEREQLLQHLDDERAQIRKKAYAAGLDAGTRGIVFEGCDSGATLIHLPLPAPPGDAHPGAGAAHT